jgi:hypothetical protein
MKLFDLHSHWGTERGYVLRTADALAQQKNTWNSTPQYDTEESMANYLRANNVRTILDFGFTKNYPLKKSSRSMITQSRRKQNIQTVFLGIGFKWILDLVKKQQLSLNAA